MIQFIFLFPVLYFLVKKNTHGFGICIAINICYEVIFQRAYDMNENYYRMLVFRYVFLIAAGILLAEKKYKKINKILLIITMMMGIAYIIIYRYRAHPLYVFRYWIGTSILASLYIVPVVFLLLDFFKKWQFKPLEIVGKASFDIFLTQMIYYNFDNYVNRLIDSRILQMVVGVIICVLGGVVFYYVEVPITNYIRRIVLKKLSGKSK